MLSLDVVLTLQTLYSIWNLNFFHTVGPDIIYFSVTSHAALCLEYNHSTLTYVPQNNFYHFVMRSSG